MASPVPTPTPPANGTTSEEIAYNLPEWMAISAFLALAWYNILQLNVSIYMTFKRRRGLYFWSLLISGWGVIFHSLGFLLKLFQITKNDYVSITFITIGWWPMVTGQALVLYSRLHLVVKERNILRGVLFMIIWNAITLQLPTTVFTYGSSSPDWPNFLPGFDVMERLQMTIFSLQEIIISSIYLWAAFRLLAPVYRRKTRSVMAQLIWINLIMVLMDVSMLVMEYLNNYAVEATLKSMIYAIKLVLEFAVLNQLMLIATTRTQHDLEAGAQPPAWQDDGNRLQRPQVHRNASSTVFAKRHPFETDSPDEMPSPADMLPGSLASPFKDTISSPFGRARGLSVVTAHSNESLHRKPKRPSFVSNVAEEPGHSGSVVSTIINNPAAFAPERRRFQDSFPIDALSPVPSQHMENPLADPALTSGQISPRARSPKPPSPTHAPSRHSSVKKISDGAVSDGSLTNDSQENRFSRRSAVVPDIISRNTYAISTKSCTDINGPDPELLRPRSDSVHDFLEITGDGLIGEEEEALTRHIADVEEDLLGSQEPPVSTLEKESQQGRSHLSKAAGAQKSLGRNDDSKEEHVEKNIQFLTSAI